MPTASAPAKCILFGEHAAVYGHPAIAVPISGLRAFAENAPNPPGVEGLHIVARDLDQTLPVDIHAETIENALALTAQLTLRKLNVPPPDLTLILHSDIPLASGLGSGAAVSAAIARALCAAVGRTLSDTDLNALVYEVEKIHHGTPSGIDNTVIVYERPVYFVRGQPMQTFVIRTPLHLLIADTGIASSTRVVVSAVRELVLADPARYEPMLTAIGAIASNARHALERGQMTLIGDLMKKNQSLLRDFQVSSPELETLISAAQRAGALGAKLSGAGRGGNLIALVTPPTRAAVESALHQAGAKRVYYTQVR